MSEVSQHNAPSQPSPDVDQASSPSQAPPERSRTPEHPTPQPTTPAKSTPVRGKISSRERHSANSPKERQSKRTQVGTEMGESFVQIAFDKFLDEFVPGADPTPDERAKFKDFSGVCLDKTEADMYPGFCASVQSVLQNTKKCGLVVRDIADWPDVTTDEAADSELRPDVGLYPSRKEAQDAFKVDKKRFPSEDKKNPKLYEARKRWMARVSWAYLCVPFEFKLASSDNVAFEFSKSDPKKLLRNTAGGIDARGQLCQYAAQLLLRQHRVFCFITYIVGSMARLIRWDRAGAVVSEPIDYVEHPEKMQNFIRRVGKLTNVQRGYDPTATPLSAKEKAGMLKITEGLTLSDTRKKDLEEMCSDGYPLYKVKVRAQDFPSDDESQEPRRKHFAFIIGRPRFAHHSPTGRATRGYVAFDMDTHKLVFLKDSWRVDSPNVRPEGEVYARLKHHRVANIATLICAGDVMDRGAVQRTRSQEFNKILDRRIHYRLVVKQIGRPLEDYAHTKEMVTVICDALLAHSDAWAEAGILHRDISPGNILIDDEPELGDYYLDDPEDLNRPIGFLNDWDLCKYKEDLSRGPAQKERSGTWQFMSALLLRYPGKVSEVSDDLESFVHVIIWLALKYHAHQDLDNLDFLETYVFALFEDWTLENGVYKGGMQKLNMMKGGSQLRLNPLLEEPSLEQMIRDLLDACQKHYATVDFNALERLTGPPRPSAARRSTVPGTVRFKQYKRIKPLSEPALSVSQPAPQVLGAPVLADHDKMVEILLSALNGPKTWQISQKLTDQFAGFTNRRDRLLSSFASTTSGKRRMDTRNAESDTQSRLKRSKLSNDNQQEIADGSTAVSHASSGGSLALSPPESRLEVVLEDEALH